MFSTKRCGIAIYLSSILLIFFIPIAYSKISPDDFVRELSNKLLRELDMQEDNLRDNSELAHSIAQRIILPEIDVHGMSRSALGRKVWNTMTLGAKRQIH